MEKHPEYKACVQKPYEGGFIDVLKTEEAESLKDVTIIMSLEEAFEYMKHHARIFSIEEDRNKHDVYLPDEVRNYILDNETIDPNLPA